MVALAAAAALVAAPLHAQATSGMDGARADGAAPGGAIVGTMVIAHGSGPEWNARVETIVELVATDGPVEVSYLMGQAADERAFQKAARRLVDAGADEIVVVPLMMSSHSGHYNQIRYLAGELDSISERMMHHLHRSGITRADVEVPIHLTPAIDDSPEIAPVLADRALALADGPVSGQALFLVGHGPNSAEDYAGWMANLRPIAAEVKALTDFADVKVGLIRDDAPDPVRAEAVTRIREIIELQHALTDRPVVVVPVLISVGRITNEKLPRDLAELPIAYDGQALLPHPGIADWIEARVRQATGAVARAGS